MSAIPGVMIVGNLVWYYCRNPVNRYNATEEDFSGNTTPPKYSSGEGLPDYD